MTVENENSYRELAWTQVETSFNPQFRAEREEDVDISFLNAATLVVSELTLGSHFDVTLDGDNNVTVIPLALPSANGTLLIERNTRALQETDFDDLEDFPAATHTLLHDRAMLLAAENRRDARRGAGAFTTISGFIDFRPLRVAAADPVNDIDLATKGYVLNVTGLVNLIAYVTAAAASAVAAAASYAAALVAQLASEAARDLSQLWAEQAEDTPVTTGPSKYSAHHWANKANASAALVLAALAVTDYGFITDAPTETRDYGTIP